MRRLFTLALVVGGLMLAWQQRDRIQAVWRVLAGPTPGPQVPSPALADSAQAKLASLSSRRERVALSQAEVQSLVQFRVAGYLPAYIVDPRITLEDDRLRVEARVPTAEFPRIDDLADVIGFLPDTTVVGATGKLIPLTGERVGLAVDELSAAHVPLPRGLIPTVLRRLGRTDAPGLPPDALALPLPAGAATAYIRGDSLIFLPRTDRGR
ncbi:MAG TPA: hypothetical protein VF212_11060 [Longimicrobiales bacterium]